MPDDQLGSPIAGSIFGANPQAITQPHLVTIQMQFKVEARDKVQAVLAIKRQISIGALVAPYLISMGEDAEPLTRELLEQMGIQL